MSAPRKLSDAQVASIRATRAKRDELVGKRAAATTRAQRREYSAQIRALPSVDDQVRLFAVSHETIKRIRLGYAYVAPEPASTASTNVPRGTPNNLHEVSHP